MPRVGASVGLGVMVRNPVVPAMACVPILVTFSGMVSDVMPDRL